MGLLDAFNLTTTENTGDTNGNTSTTSPATEWTNANLIFSTENTGDTNGNTSTTSAATKWTNGNLIFCYTT